VLDFTVGGQFVGIEVSRGSQLLDNGGFCLYRLNLEFKREWDGRYYVVQQVAPSVAEEEHRFVVITVYPSIFRIMSDEDYL
jgi:hypothetical protein